MKQEIKNISVESVFRIIFFITLVITGFFSLLNIIVSLFTGQLLMALLIFAVGAPLIALMEGALAALFIFIYNAFAKKFGGFIIDLGN
ncbi:MAG: hypothetical protein JW827_04765 [Spirochaetes bacterium]|nr:hypothetical protein [Spirochaetota bacterium]